MSAIGGALYIHGDIDTDEDLVIEGRVRGRVWTKNCSITVGPDGEVTGDITARRITVAGIVNGNLSAGERVEIGATARVRGRVIASAFVLHDGARYTGAVHVQRLDAASSLAHYRARKGDPLPK